MKLIKKGKEQEYFITGDDVVITKGVEHAGEDVNDAIVDIDNTLDKHQKDIDRLKSNMKYIYSYGGVGGSGNGGSGGGSGGGQTGTPTLVATLGGRQIQNGTDNVIILNGKGTYMLEGNLLNSNGETYRLTVAYGNNIDSEDPPRYMLTPDNKWRITNSSGAPRLGLELQDESGVGEIELRLYNSEWGLLSITRQTYILEPHKFEAMFMYKFDGGTGVKEYEFNKPYEYFIGHPTYRDPFVDISFKITLPNVSNVSVEYKIGDTDEPVGHKTVGYGTNTDITNDHLKIPIGDLTRNGISFLDKSNSGTYTVTVTLSYDANAMHNSQTVSFQFTMIPNDLYINVRNPQNILYNTLEDLLEDASNGVDGVPDNYLNIGTYTSFYCKVYEGTMSSQPRNYVITFKVYDYVESDSDTYFEIDDDKTQPNLSGFREQVERAIPISAIFDTPGIKKLEFSTKPQKSDVGSPIVKYIYVKEADQDRINWYPDISQEVFYFRANSGNDTYSEGFPHFSSPNPVELSEASTPMSITDPLWMSSSHSDATILSFGIQYSSVNPDGAQILSIYDTPTSNDADLILYSNKLFSNSKKIFIPTESNFNKSENKQYHLVQIVNNRIGYDSGNNPQYASYLYIDGVLESNKPFDSTDVQMHVGKIVFNNVNVIYNLISLQYLNYGNSTIDAIIYQYWLAYKDRMIMPGEVTKAEKNVLSNISSFKFDGKNVIVDESVVQSISREMPIPTLMVDYRGGTDEAAYNDFIEKLFAGYENASNAFKPTPIDVYWSPGYKQGIANDLTKIEIPTEISDVTSEIGETYSGSWYIDLQGTSTMRNKIKNFMLSIVTSNSVDNKEILMSPNYDPSDGSTFLPESAWTLKADIADSAHANNTAIGKFVNETCTKFSESNGVNLSTNVKKYIKNTLEGFPFLMFFKIGLKVYYLGVYNFNLGRKSYYNLGYHTSTDTENMITNIAPNSSENSPFKFSVGRGTVIDDLVIGEVQENLPEFDFHQYDPSVLFQSEGSKTTKMFGTPDKMTGRNAQSTLQSFVKSVARAGAYCFSVIGKHPITSNYSGEGSSSGICVNQYKLDDEGKECVPDVAWQFRYDINEEKVWSTTPGEIKFDEVGIDIDNLLQCISTTDGAGEPFEGNNFNYLDFTSVSEYYTICMAFGLVDSILKNLNIKSWNAHKCYVAFYDMDCAFGENNAGEEVISYLASTDYWYSPTTNGFVNQARIQYDYWPKSTLGPGFDYTSSYLFAIAKYAQAIYNKYNLDETNTNKLNNLTNYPQQFWTKLRRKDGPLRNADWFVDNYFSSGIGKIPAYLASLNYQVKYLYYGMEYDKETGEEKGDRYLVNEFAFNGSRLDKVRDWLNRRLHYLDVVFNVQGIRMHIGNNYYLPSEDETVLTELATNKDVVIRSDVFSTDNENTVVMTSNGRPVQIWAPQNTPFVVKRGSEGTIYVLSAETGTPNNIQVNVNNDVGLRFLGSTEFTNMNMVDPFITTAKVIYSDRLETIVSKCGNEFPVTNSPLYIRSSSAKVISLPMPSFKGSLSIDWTGLNGQTLNEIDVHGSGFTGSWQNLKNLKKLNISSVNDKDGGISIINCPLLTGENCLISGTEEALTILKTLSMVSVSGKFKLEYTNIDTIEFISVDGKASELEILGDHRLRELRVTGFKSIIVRDCPNLQSIRIVDSDEYDVNKIETLILDMPYKYVNTDGSIPTGIIIFNNKTITDGVFDFSGYSNLSKFRLSGCDNVVVIKMPDRKVSIESMKQNNNLEFVDTTGENSCIEITQDSTFYDCPAYGMRQSWASYTANGNEGSLNNKNIRSEIPDEIYNANVYTKMCVSPECTSLAQTFSKPNGGSSYYLETPYTNVWGQKVKNVRINLNDAQWFINKVVPSGKLDDVWLEHIDDNTDIIHDTLTQKTYGSGDCQGNITSLQGCFYKQTGISYYGGPDTVPNLSNYRNLTNVAGMYYGIPTVKRITSSLLSFNYEDNTNDSPTIEWNDFISSNNNVLEISKDAFKNISYRITDLSTMNLTVFNPDPNNYTQIINVDEPQNDDEWLKIEDILCIKKDGEGKDIPFEHIESFNSFNINASQYVDYRRMFEICPNVKRISGLLNIDLSRSRIDGILKPKGGEIKLQNLESISDSFNHGGDVYTLQAIDLYEFFDWTNTTLYNKMLSLFTSSARGVPGFCINKVISQEHFAEILGLLHRYENIKSLSNIFSYCTINGYSPETCHIELAGDMPKVKSINSLFYNCKSSNGSPLYIRRSFFEHLKCVTSMCNTFYNVLFDHMLSYDFFCKRKVKESSRPNVKVKVDGSIPAASNAYLTTIEYTDPIVDMNNCFCGAKFINCKCWFDVNDVVDSEGHTNDYYKPPKDVVTYNGDSSYTTYYIRQNTVDVEYNITEPSVITDTYNLFTNFETGPILLPLINDSAGTSQQKGLNNHRIINELDYFNNLEEDSPYITNSTGLYPTYCCLPPDIFHGCSDVCDLTNVFANTNIIGVLPQHLLVNVYNGYTNNMFKNVNIMPNVIYHYDKKCNQAYIDSLDSTDTRKQEYTSLRQEYLDLIKDIDVDETTIMSSEVSYTLVGNVPTDSDSSDAIVLFRNGNGELKRRRPIETVGEVVDGEYSKSQFVYVPQGFSQNTHLTQAFTFRYNLPKNVDLYREKLRNEGIVWSDDLTVKNFDSSYSPENKPWLWPHYTQYFFTVDESINWSRITDMSSPFISDEDDVDYSIEDPDERKRQFSTGTQGYPNVWWNNQFNYVYPREGWHQNTNGVLNIFLNLCGERDVNTGKIYDSGCFISRALGNTVQIGSFISGSLVAFLNGRIFDSACDTGMIDGSNCVAGPVVRYDMGCGRNLIFPSFNYLPSGYDNAPRVFIQHDNTSSRFYKFMFPSGISNYMGIFNITEGSQQSCIPSDGVKYMII